MPSLHRHREIEVNLIVRGELEYLFGGNRVVLPEGQLAVFWATIPHGVVGVIKGTRYFCIHLPLVRFLRWQLPGELTRRLLHGEVVREEDTSWAARDFSLFEQWRQDLDRDIPDVNQVVLLELEARLRRLAWSISATAASAGEDALTVTAPHTRDPSADHVERMAVFITEHYQERITTADIAGAVNLHPKYATSLFRDHCGMTPGEYLTQHRLSQAQRLLATTDARVVDIAFAAGFGSVSQFYEVFIRFCNQSPKDFRMAQR